MRPVAGGSVNYYHNSSALAGGGGGFDDFHARFPDGQHAPGSPRPFAPGRLHRLSNRPIGQSPRYELMKTAVPMASRIMREDLPPVSITKPGAILDR